LEPPLASSATANPVFSALVSSAAAAVLMLGCAAPAHADTPGETFNKTCAGCHAAGGNIVQAGATLFPADLERNGVNDAETIYKLISLGKNKMPGYGEACEPRGQCTFGARLSDDEVKGLAEYVVEESKRDWK
jgi:cytochrome c6